MPKFLIAGLLLVAGTVGAAPKKPSVHEQIAGYAAAIGTNLLAQDLEDKHGLLLLRFARTLQPESDTVLLTTAMLERGKKPKPIETKVTEAKLYEVIASQGDRLRLREWPKNTKAGQLALLYYHMADRFQPGNKDIMLGLMKLRVRGVDGDLEQALMQTSDLKDVFGNPEKPKPLPKSDLAEVDRNIAKYAAIWATNRLAMDTNDTEGLVLLRLASCLTPESSTALLTLGLLERNKKPAGLKSDQTEEKLLDVIIGRAGRLLARELKTDKNAGQLSLLYFKVAERFRPEEDKVLVGLMKLKGRGIDGELDELLAAGPSVAVVVPARERKLPAGAPLRPGGGKRRTIPKLGLELLPVKPGSFTMGSADIKGSVVHEVRLTQAFWLGKYEVTQDQYAQVMGKNPSYYKGANRPVEQTSSENMVEFCAQLNERARKAGRLPKGYEYRLPTEAEWEYSCRAGTRTVRFFGDDVRELGDYAWNSSNSGAETHEVGQKKPNPWGFYDMFGNLWETCSDVYGDSPYGAALDPVGPSLCEKGRRRARGGAWSHGDAHCLAAFRVPMYRGWRTMGFRIALAPVRKRAAPADPGRKGKRPRNPAAERMRRGAALGYRLGGHAKDAKQWAENKHWYKFFEAEMSWREAWAKCKELDGYLATVADEPENEFIWGLCGGKGAWLGATDAKEEGRWKWITGEPFTYANWGPGQPNDLGEGGDYLHLALDEPKSWSKLWNDAKVDRHLLHIAGVKGFVCEWER